MQRAIMTVHICPVRGRGKRRNSVWATSKKKNKMQTERDHRPLGMHNGYGVQERKQDISLGSRHVPSVCKRARCNSSVVMNLNSLSPARLLLPEPPSATTTRSVYCPSAPRAVSLSSASRAKMGLLSPLLHCPWPFGDGEKGKARGKRFESTVLTYLRATHDERLAS